MTDLAEGIEEIATRRLLAEQVFGRLPLQVQEELLRAVDVSPKIAVELQDGRWEELARLLREGSSQAGCASWRRLATLVVLHTPGGLEG